MVDRIRDTANEQLKLVTVNIPAISFPGTVWNVGEYAYVVVEVINSTGLPLRDVSVRLRVKGAAKVAPFWIFTCKAHWDDLERGERKRFFCRLKAVSRGDARLGVVICAEVVPYVCRYAAFRSVEVWPD